MFWLIIPMSFLQPGFACGCGGEYPLSLTDQILTWIVKLVFLLIYLIPTFFFVKFYKVFSLKIIHIIIPHFFLFLMIWLLNNTVNLGLMKIYDQIRDVISPLLVIFIVGIVGIFLWFYPIIYILQMKVKRTTSKV